MSTFRQYTSLYYSTFKTATHCGYTRQPSSGFMFQKCKMKIKYVAVHLNVKTYGRGGALTLSTCKLHVWRAILQYINVLYKPLLI